MKSSAFVVIGSWPVGIAKARRRREGRARRDFRDDLVEIVAQFDPKVVRMCGDGSKAED